MLSSLLDVGRSTGAVFNKFSTIRTVTTEATSESPSFTRTEGSSVAEDLALKRAEYKYNESVVDLSRVVEESDEGTQSRGNSRHQSTKRPKDTAEEKPERPALRLGKGKWPEDFMDAIQNSPTRASPIHDNRAQSPASSNSSGPRKLAIVGRSEGIDDLPQFPRRPSHRARHSLDAPPALLPKDPGLRRDASPDSSAHSRVMLRRHSTKPPQRSNSALRGIEGSDSSDGPVPFPRTPSGEHSPNSNSRPSSSDDRLDDKVRPPRGRFQSDVGGSGRRPRPSSYDELGAKPIRNRFESMVNLGGTGNASASDLMSRDSMDGSAVRKALIIKEEGKPSTHFQLGNCIGRGQFGSVYRALNLNTGQMVAVKRIRLEGLKEDEVTTLMREVDLVKSLSHPTIVKYEGMARDADTLSIVLEYAENGSLGQTLKAFGKLNERLVASYVVKILEGLHYLHQCDVVHCDLKAANILTTKNGNVKLSDFGVSLNMRAVERDIKDVAGTPNWMAPEVIELKGASPKSDIWSLACTVIELLTGRPPYGEIANSMTVMFRIVEDDRPPIPEGCSPPLEDFLKQCFSKDPSRRPSAEMLCEHQWLKMNWGVHKELRPQDSIPFLRRVSADLNKSDAARIFNHLDIPESPTAESTPRTDDFVSGSPPNQRRLSNASQRPPVDNDIAPREHSFVKTTFSKPMVCRVCLLNVKKNAVLCAECSLICHSKCAPSSPPTCDLRAQLLLYAQYAEKGNPGSVYSNPLDLRNEFYPKSPMSDVSYVEHNTPRSSIDLPPPMQSPPPPPSPGHPPTAYKLMAPFKRKNVTSPEPGQSSSTSLPVNPSHEQQQPKPKVVLRKERPPSVTSNSTHATSSMRSTSTTAESTGRRSAGGKDALASIGEGDVTRSSRARSDVSGDERVATHWQMPGGDLAGDPKRHRKNKSSANCTVQ